MQSLYYTATKGLRLTKLYDELSQGIPALGADPNGWKLLGNEGTGEVWLRAPDAINASDVAVIVAAHDATPPTPPAYSTHPVAGQTLLLKVTNGAELSSAEQALYNQYTLNMLRYLERASTGKVQ